MRSFLFSAILMTAATAFSAQPEEILVTGNVKTWDGKAEVTGWDNVHAFVEHPSQGGQYYRFRDRQGGIERSLWMGKTTIQARADGYAPRVFGPYEAGDPRLAQPFHIVLEPGFTAELQFTDLEGNPVPNVTVEWRNMLPYRQNEWKKMVRSESSGRAYLEHVSKEVEVLMDVSAPGYELDRKKVLLEPDEPLEWTLRPAEPTSGEVVQAETGEPIPDAKIVLLSQHEGKFYKGTMVHVSSDEFPFKNPIVLDTTDREGNFVLDTLREDSLYNLLVMAPDQSMMAIKEVLAGEEVRAEVPPPLYIEGKFVGDLSQLHTPSHHSGEKPGTDKRSFFIQMGAPAQQNRGFSGLRIATVTSDNEAVFRVDRLWPGEYRIKDWTGTLADQPITNVVIQLAEETTPAPTPGPADAREIVVNFPMVNGEEVEGVLAADRRYGYGSYDLKGSVIDDGTARFEAPAPLTLSLSPRGLRNFWFRPFKVEVPAGEKAFIKDVPAEKLHSAGTISGRFLKENGEGATGVRYHTVQVAGPETVKLAGETNFRWDIDTFNDRDAWDRIDFTAGPLLLDRTYRIIAAKDNYLATGPAIELTADSRHEKLDLLFREGVAVEGTVRDAEGKPLPRAKVSMRYLVPIETDYASGTHENVRIHGLASETTKASGRFIFEGINPGLPFDYQIAVDNVEGKAPHLEKITDLRSPLEIFLPEGVSVSGKLVSKETGEPFAETRVSLGNLDPEKRHGLLYIETATDGSFIFDHLAGGDYELRATIDLDGTHHSLPLQRISVSNEDLALGEIALKEPGAIHQWRMEQVGEFEAKRQRNGSNGDR